MMKLNYITTQALLKILLNQAVLQEQLYEAQQRVIELQERLNEAQQEVINLHKRVNASTPPTPRDGDVFWHIASNGVLSVEAAASDDLAQVTEFLEWNLRFAEVHIKPYVNPLVFSETVNQMTRGLPERIAELETRQYIQKKAAAKTRRSRKKQSDIIQLPLLPSGA